MDALAAGQLGPAFETFTFQEIAGPERGFEDALPRDAFAGIDVDDQVIGMFDVIYQRIPRVELDGADLDEAEEAVQIIDPKPGAFAALPLLDSDVVHAGRDRRQRALVVEGGAVHMPDQLERPVAEMRQSLLPDARPVSRELLLRRSDRVGQKLKNILARDADMRLALTT